MQSIALALTPAKAPIASQGSNVLIVYTGGTIGMQPGSDGALKPCKGFLTSMIPKMDELLRPGMPLTTGQFQRLLAHACMLRRE